LNKPDKNNIRSLDTAADPVSNDIQGDDSKKPSMGFYVLPNLFTSAGLFAGFYAIMQAHHGNFEAACLGIFVALIMDIIDGRLARLTNTMSEFGEQYDSLADMVSFGVAPALIMFEFAIGDLGRWGSLAAFIFVACAALRLARFNVQSVSAKRHFIGLPSPGAAGLIASLVWVLVDYQVAPQPYAVPLMLVLIIAALSMVSNIRYRSFKDLDVKDKMPFIGLIALIVVISIIYLDPPMAFALVGSAYLISGYIGYLLRFGRSNMSANSAEVNDEEI
jgi:CDP-diacylglycerol--serine O-phosphatidyltransferase